MSKITRGANCWRDNRCGQRQRFLSRKPRVNMADHTKSTIAERWTPVSIAAAAGTASTIKLTDLCVLVYESEKRARVYPANRAQRRSKSVRRRNV